MIDYHIHSNYSADSKQTIEDIICAARKKGIQEIAITDHKDFEYPYDNITFDFDTYKRSEALDRIKKENEDIKILDAIEIGITPNSKKESTDFIKARSFDYIISSIHVVDGIDPYYKEYFEGKTTRQAYTDYLQEIIKCLEGFDSYSVIGHIGYAARTCEDKVNKVIEYTDYSDLIDTILKTVIQKGKGIEINTKGVSSTGDTLPAKSIIKRYKDLGGEIITIGSDSHVSHRVGEYVKETYEFLKSIGYEYVTHFERLNPYFVKI